MKSLQQWLTHTTPQDITQQHTMPQVSINTINLPHVPQAQLATEMDDQQLPYLDTTEAMTSPPDRKKVFSRALAIILVIAFAIGLYIVWQPGNATPSEPDTTSTNMSLALTPIATDNTSGTTPPQSAPESAADATPGENAIKIYIVGAIQHPGIYTLASDARIYQLVQAAGGPTSNANLVALNLAAHLSDGQEIYVPRVGENAPTLTSTSTTTDTTNTSSSSNSSSNTTRVNINTASVDELRQQLHTTSTIAQEIVGYRLQHGPFASVDILQQVVSKSEYAKLKDMVTV